MSGQDGRVSKLDKEGKKDGGSTKEIATRKKWRLLRMSRVRKVGGKDTSFSIVEQEQ